MAFPPGGKKALAASVCALRAHPTRLPAPDPTFCLSPGAVAPPRLVARATVPSPGKDRERAGPAPVGAAVRIGPGPGSAGPHGCRAGGTRGLLRAPAYCPHMAISSSFVAASPRKGSGWSGSSKGGMSNSSHSWKRAAPFV